MFLQRFYAGVPADVEEALIAVKGAYPGAIVAGGCLRDAILGVPHRDIDIFVGPDFDPTKLPEAWAAFVLSPETFVQDYAEHFAPRLKAVWGLANCDGELLGPAAAQIIVMAEPIKLPELLADFDWGFCQIGGHTLSKLFCTDAFRADMNNNTATLTAKPGDPRMERMLRRGKEFQRRFPDRRFLVPMGV